MAPSTTVIAATMYAPQQTNGAGQPSNQQEQLDSIRSRLMTSIGVQLSTEWLQACLSHIQNKQQSLRLGGGGVLIDAVLHKVLYSDLRDVVRATTPRNSNSDHTASMTGDFRTAATLSGTATASSATSIPAAVTQLLQAVQQSSQPAHKFHHMLLKNSNSNSFALLVQLEEVVDVSLPAERRLEAGTGRSSNDNNQHPQQQYRNGPPPTRCLKLCLADGYNQNHTFVAMEQQAIPNLSPTSPAGLKLLLRAPLTVRHSQLLLNPGNCIVLGGVVSHLHEQQQKSLQAAILEAGVGVDPTIRALIGTGAAANEDENEDEAHEASGDVQSHAQQPLQQFQTATAQQQQQQRSMPPPPVPARSTSRLSNTYNAGSATSSTRSAWAGSSVTTTAPTATTNPYGARNHHQQQHRHHTPPPTSQSRPSAINPYASATSQVSTSTTASTATTATTNNPYLSSRNTAVASNTTTSITGAATTASTIPSNPYQRSSSSAATAVTRAPSNLATANCSTAMVPASSNPALQTTPASTAAQSVAPSAVASFSSPSPAIAIQNMDMPALYQLLTNLISNREMYESYYTQQNMTFRVQLKQFAEVEKIIFNVVKTKKNKKRDGTSNIGEQRKQKKKYEYLVAAVFEGAGRASNLSQKHVLACRIHPDLVEPHFPVSAAELRSMNRSQRGKCEEITRVGGDKIKEAYFYKLNSWTATLHLSPDQVFAEEIVSNKSIAERLADTELPILCLQDPKPSV